MTEIKMVNGNKLTKIMVAVALPVICMVNGCYSTPEQARMLEIRNRYYELKSKGIPKQEIYNKLQQEEKTKLAQAHKKEKSLAESLLWGGEVSATIQPMKVNAPWGPIQVVSYKYDEQTQKGQLSVDISERGFETRRWIIKNIGEICSNQNIALEAGKEPTKGGYYKILKESVKDGILTIEFKALY